MRIKMNIQVNKTGDSMDITDINGMKIQIHPKTGLTFKKWDGIVQITSGD